MPPLKPTKTVYSVSQFLDHCRQGNLDLHPCFQRREVWKSPAKSHFIDSLIRGYPVPIILLRQVHDLRTMSSKLEVIDGQQRLRTILSFVDPKVLSDFDEPKDRFTVRRIHNANPTISGKRFSELPEHVQLDLLAYELSTHVFPADTGDELVYRIFARLNSTGLPLKPQEIRNAEFHGVFKSMVYDLGFEYLDFWRDCGIFTDESISRMAEAEAVSECLLLMLHGITAKKQTDISKWYKVYEDALPQAHVLRSRFENVINALVRSVGELLPKTRFTRPALFFSLFAAVYDHMYALKSRLDKRRPNPLPKNFRQKLAEVSERIRLKELSRVVADAMEKATADKKRRDVRHRFLMRALDLEPNR